MQSDVNRLYNETKALHQYDFDPKGFEWIDCHDAPQSVLSYLRRAGDEFAVVILNFTPVPRPNYRIGLPHAGKWREVLNSDAGIYGGGNQGNLGGVTAGNHPCHGQQHSAEFYLPPLSALAFAPDQSLIVAANPASGTVIPDQPAGIATTPATKRLAPPAKTN